MQRYDAIIIGAGHNGLVCAARLARAGRRVLVLEAADQPGGLAARHEFHPGFRACPAHTAAHFSARIATDLGLSGGALPTAPRLVGLASDGAHVVVENGAVTGVGAEDADAFRELDALLDRFAATLEPFWGRTIPRIGGPRLADKLPFAQLGFALRRLGRERLHEFLRIAALPARDLLDERFEHPLLKATLGWDGLVGSRMAPRSPNGAVLAMLYRRGRQAWAPSKLIDALVATATSAGAELRTGTRVTRVLVEGAADGIAATGVELADGEQLRADSVVSSADPQTTFLRLVGVRHLDVGFTNRIRRLRAGGLVAKLHLALAEAPRFTGLDSPAGRLLTAPTMDAIEFAFDDAKYGGVAAQPVLEVAVPSLDDASLAPAGQHVLSAHVMYVPHALEGGWTDAARDAIAERAIDVLERHAPGLRRSIVAREFLAPPDIEARHGVAGGHWHHGDFAMDQLLMMRPTYDAAQYRTPLPGLWLCGAGCHPAGDLTGLAGDNAARELLR